MSGAVDFNHVSVAYERTFDYENKITSVTEDGEPRVKAVVLEDIDLNVTSGECILFCGRSGSGKTTISKCINGLIPHFETGVTLSGNVEVAGFDIGDVNMYELAESVGSVFQNPKSQFFNLVSDDELVFGLEAAGFDVNYIDERILKVVRDMGIKHLLHRNVAAMSGGEKQSLVFASVYAMNPDIYVLDEPTANLDEAAIAVLRDQISQAKHEGKTIFIAEHRLAFLVDLIDRAFYVDKGKIVYEFTQEEFRSLSNERRISLGLRTLVPNDGARNFVSHVASHASQNAGLELKDFSCALKKNTIISSCNLEAKRGAVMGLVGTNGCGKTTLLRALAGLERRESGTILLDGHPLKRKDRNKLSYLVMQDVNHQLFASSVELECRLACQDAREEEIDAVLNSLNLLEFKHRHPMSLSGGQKQRLAVAGAFLADAQILLFDEPTSGLDFEHMVEVSSLVRRAASRDIVVIVATHDREFIECTCDAIIDLSI